MATSHVTCPACGRAIDAQAMINGKYDNAGGDVEGIIFLMTWVGGMIVFQAIEYRFWPSLGLSFWIALSAAIVWGTMAWLFEKVRR